MWWDLIFIVGCMFLRVILNVFSLDLLECWVRVFSVLYMIDLVVDFLLFIIRIFINLVSSFDLNFGFGRILCWLMMWWCGMEIFCC